MKKKMTLNRALRYKKRVIESIQEFRERVSEYNSCSVVDGESNRDHCPKKNLELYQAWVNHLIDLKLKTQKATFPIQELIFKLAEAKSEINFLKTVPTRHGKQRPTYRDESEVVYDAIFKNLDIESKVSELKTFIDDTQTQIDLHNSETFIELEIPE